jgi:hypothetical protein
MERVDIEARRRRAERIAAGLPSHVMDECVADVAEAVIAMLLAGEQPETDEDDTSSHLRPI